MAHRSPKELIQLYWTEVWNNRNAEMIRELCADPIIRHDPGSTTPLSLEDQIARVRQQSEKAEPYFEHEVLLADDEYVTSVWNMYTRKGGRVDLCGIEVFRAKDGKFTDCWNSSYVAGRWGREGDAAVPDNLPPPGLIASVDGVTPAWLQSVFQHAGLDMPRVSMASAEAIGHGNLSATYRVAITYNANAAEAVNSVVCKLTPLVAQTVQQAADAGVHGREVAVYDLFGDTPPLNVPRAYLAKVSEDNRLLNLVMEDLTGRTRSGNQLTGCSADEARAVVAEFAKLHTAYWGAPALEADWLLGRAATGEAAAASYASGADIFRARFEGRVDSRYLNAMDSWRDKVAGWTRDKTGTQTLIHGEPRVDNILFEDRADGVAAWLIDWQFADRGCPMFDVAYFMAGSLESPVRKACEDALIAAHHAAVAGVAPDWSLEAARKAYADALPFALFTTVGAANVLAAGEHEDKLLLALLTRNVDALADWGMV
jgi:aminoglycoside phosphotransferase (APT) family kinase protein